jgi:phage terminase large subunit-like protein
MADWVTACPDWEERIVNRRSLIPCTPLFPEVAEIAIEVFGDLIVPDMTGLPRMREVMPPWVLDFVGSIFGALDPYAQRRLIKKFFLLISKKNAKSTIAAGIMITALELNERNLAEAIILAPTKEVADNSFKPAAGMIEFDPQMRDKYNISKHTRTITHLATKSTLKVVAADDKTAGGLKAAFVLIDEMHLFGAMANAESVIKEATGGLMSKPDGFLIILSTQSKEPPAGVFKTELAYARSVRDGGTADGKELVDKTYLPVLYEFPASLIKSGAYKKPENFYITNPSLGYSVDEAFLISEYRQAELKGEQTLIEFEAKHLNKEVGLNLRSDRWSGADYWLAQSDDTLTLDTLLSRSEVVVIGLDGGGNDDLFGLAVVGREKGTQRWLTWCYAWANPPVLNNRKDILPQLEGFVKDGDMTFCQNVGDDLKEVAEICLKVGQTGLLHSIAVDRYGMEPVLQTIHNKFIDNGYAFPPDGLFKAISQGFKMTGTIKATERALASKEMWHANQPLMNWNVGNARVIQSGNGIQVTKQYAGFAKIDSLMALFDAVAVMATNPASRYSGGIDSFLDNFIIG